MAKDAKSKTTVAEAKKKPEVKTAADVKIAEVKTADPKKVAARAKKTIKEKTIMTPEVFVEYTDNGEQTASVADIVAKIKEKYVAEGHRESSIKSLKVYMKPQEWKAYYVINNKIESHIDLF